MDYGFAMRFLTPPKTAFLLGVDRRACLQWQTESRPSSESSFSKDIALGFSGKLGIISGRELNASMFFGGQVVDIVLDFVSWLWIGRFFESSQDCELTHVQSSSKNTFKKKGWVKLSVCQNFAVRNTRGGGCFDQIWPSLWPLVLPSMMAKVCHIIFVHTMMVWILFQKRSRSESRLQTLFTNVHLEAWDLCICQRSAKAADWGSLTLQMIRLLIIPLSIHLNVQVAWWKIIKKEVLLLCTVKMAWFKDLRMKRGLHFELGGQTGFQADHSFCPHQRGARNFCVRPCRVGRIT